jgi:hypothetical protein
LKSALLLRFSQPSPPVRSMSSAEYHFQSLPSKVMLTCPQSALMSRPWPVMLPPTLAGFSNLSLLPSQSIISSPLLRVERAMLLLQPPSIPRTQPAFWLPSPLLRRILWLCWLI